MKTKFLNQAVTEKKVIKFTFKGQECVAEPHAVGVGHDGSLTVSAYQISGPTQIPGFRWLYKRVDDLKNLQLLSSSFKPRQEHSKRDARFQKIIAAV